MIESKLTSLFLITAYNFETKQENIIFANFKEEMSNNIENKLVRKVKLSEDKDNKYYQRFYVAEKSFFKEKYFQIISENNLQLFGENFSLNCKLEKIEQELNYNSVEGYKKDEKYFITEYKYQDYEDLDMTNFLFLNSEFSKCFKGIKDRKKSSIFYPFKYINLDTLDKYIYLKKCIRYEELFLITDFRGDEENKDLEPKKYIGKINYAPIRLNEIAIAILSENEKIYKIPKERWIKVDNKTGKWECNLQNRMAKGIVAYKNIKNDQIIAASKFALMMKFNLNVISKDEQFKDLYEEDIYYSKSHLKNNENPKKLESKTFFKRSYPNHEEKKYSMEISKYIENILEIMGKEIYIVDPYLLGKINNGKLNFSQVALVNAIFKTLTKFKIEKIYFVGSEIKCKRAKIYKKEEYDNLIKDINKIQNIESKVIKLAKVFHDRYIIGINSNKVVSITVSTNGLINSDEVTFHVLKNNDAKRIIKQYKEWM